MLSSDDLASLDSTDRSTDIRCPCLTLDVTMEVCSDGDPDPKTSTADPPPSPPPPVMSTSLSAVAPPPPRKMSDIFPAMPSNLVTAICNMQKSITNLKKSPWLLSRSKDIQSHFESISDLLRSEDKISVVVRLENSNANSLSSRYLVVVSTVVSQNDDDGRVNAINSTATDEEEDQEESVLLGIDVCKHCSSSSIEEDGGGDDDDGRGSSMAVTTENVSTVGLVLPITGDFVVSLEGDGGFTVTTRKRQSPYLFKPTSVQAMWSALQCLGQRVLAERALGRSAISERRFTWTSVYKQQATASTDECIEEWIRMPDVESSKEDRRHSNIPLEQRKIIDQIRQRIKDIMMKAEDLDTVTSRYVRETLEAEMLMPLTEHKQLINEEMLVVMRQMDSPSRIFSYLYLGSEWNASNLDELQRNRVGSIVNVTVEIDNFFPGLFRYHNVRVNDDEQTELMKHWQETYSFISDAKKKHSRVLVHCKMGVSRSASTVIAFAMKEYGWSLERALDYVKQKRPCVKPNPGFMKQLFVYEGILNANRFHPSKMLMRCRSCSADNLDKMSGIDEDEDEVSRDHEKIDVPDGQQVSSRPMSATASLDNLDSAALEEEEEDVPKKKKVPTATLR